MKKFSIFGHKFSIDISKENNMDKEIYSENAILKEKIFYLLLVMFCIAGFSKVPVIFKTNNYSVGDFVKSDIYAPKTIVFKDRSAKEKIIEEMIAQVNKEYIYSSDVSSIYLNELENFYKEIYALKNGNLKTFDYTSFEKKTGKKISENLVDNLLKMPEKDIRNLFERIEKLLQDVYTAGVYREKNNIRIAEPLNATVNELDGLDKELFSTFLEANYIYDENKTKENIQEKVLQIKDQYIEIKAGTLIASTGEVLTQRKINILERLGIYTYKTSIGILILNTIYLLIISTIFFAVLSNFYKKEILNKNKYRALMLLISITLITFLFTPHNLIYLIPLDTILFLLLFITTPRFSIFFFTIILTYILSIIDFDLKFFAIHTMVILIIGVFSKQLTTRSAIIAVGIQLAVLKFLLFFIFSFFAVEETYGTALNAIKIFSSGLFSGMFTIALLPYFEKTFNILTIFRLIELGDLSHPLLRKLSLEAPGTFQHSMMVAILSENAVVQIGGNPVFTRVACYYHDIGKCRRPRFFVENQSNGENLHDGLSPFLSKLLILSHTKDGAEMAKKYQIPKEIRDVMFEHHGTTHLAFFYNKAKSISDEVTEEEFRYSGPKPQSKESAVIMLADSIEATVRSLTSKDPVTIENAIRKIVKSKIEDNQLSEANITLKEIEITINSFVKTLTAVYHQRIKYPGQKN